MDALTLGPIKSLSGEVRLPGSKSISNRALLLAALARGRTRILNLLDSEDTELMRRALNALGIAVTQDRDAWVVEGGGPLVTDGRCVELNLGLAGTAMRPLVAALTLGNGEFVLDGTPRMRERPIGPLVDALRALGADLDYAATAGYPPVRIRAGGLAGGEAEIDGSLSSQFLTSVLLAAPLAQRPVTLRVHGGLVSKPYIDITLDLMSRFGAAVHHVGHQRFEVANEGYRSPGECLVEGDASSATYFLAAGAIAGRGVRVEGVGAASIQGDAAFAAVLEAMGARVERSATSVAVKPAPLSGIDADLNHIPDAAMTVAVLALFAKGVTRIGNIANWRVKETDRLSAMAQELRKLGAEVEEGPDYLAIEPPATLRPATIETYGDHRMAMCFSLAALGGVPVTIKNPGCVAKTFPDYFEKFTGLIDG
ncbi:MAG: 3-phosphoshikimate 1-carboxyvinyltransferase [Gammaproteobacteria bacterium]|nr:3-phosphoshikimate 1-carboxyvinyltransferase [Gammaproteobacteria bacterium]MYK84417.1 3-phosphoshikimate 1-carboxyvinyltransferase [Gammaproteobacteria bacterium]